MNMLLKPMGGLERRLLARSEPAYVFMKGAQAGCLMGVLWLLGTGAV